MHLIISDTKTGKSYKAEIPKEKESEIVGKKIGDKIEGGIIGAAGYELELTGGSDDSGFPMRDDVAGPKKMKVLLTKGVGFRAKEKGERRRKMVRGDAYSAGITEVNAKIVKAGPASLDELFKKEEEKK
jgi:small subunit ribosomal protein S6e